MCLSQGHNAVSPVRLKPATLRSQVKYCTTEPLGSPQDIERKQNSDTNQHNSVTNLRKITGKNPNLDLVNISACTKFGETLFICSQDIIERKQNYGINEIQAEIKGHNSVTNVRKMMSNNHKLGSVNINAYTKFHLKIERKQNHEGWMEMMDNPNPV